MRRDPRPARIVTYRRMQRTIPGIDGLYAGTKAILFATVPKHGRVLVVGAGGGRELELLGEVGHGLSLVAVDTSTEKLAETEAFMRASGRGDRIEYVAGSVEAAARAPLCHGATSLLVMHSIADDGGKLRYLRAIRARLSPGASFVLADVSVDDRAQFERMIAPFLEHARHADVAASDAEIDPRLIPAMPIIDDRRTRALLTEAGFGEITPFFRGFWYAGWWARAT